MVKATLWEIPGEDLNNLTAHKSENGLKRALEKEMHDLRPLRKYFP